MGYVDVHVHLPLKEYFENGFGTFGEFQKKYFRIDHMAGTLKEMMAEFDEAGIERMVVLGWDAETSTGIPGIPNDYVARIVGEYPERMIGFAGVDPHKGKAAVKELERCVKDLHMKGAKFHQSVQAFYPNDSRFNPLWEKCEELDIPVLFHMGMAAWGAGMPGGGGLKLKYADPIHIDDLAAEHPDLRIIAAHPAWPWENTLLAICLHKPNVYMELSGWMPQYIPPAVIQYANTLLSNKTMFGSDYPFISPKRWLEAFDRLNLKPESREKILEKNARAFLRL